MVTKVRRWGNSQGLRLSKQILQAAHVSVGDDVDVAVRGGVIVVTPVKQTRQKTALRRLVARIPKNYKPKVTDWGMRVGQEAW